MDQTALFEAMKVIAEQVIKNQNFQKTVTGIIKSEKKESGAFDVEYQGATIEAFAMDSGSIFEIDDMVYLLLPNGDINGTRLILGLVSKSRTATIDMKDFVENNSVTTGKNYILQPTDAILNSLVKKTNIEINPVFGAHHNQGMSHIRIRTNVYSSIKQASNVTFGVRVFIKYMNEEPIKFEFNQMRMEGAINNLIGNVQDRVFPIQIGKEVENVWGEYFYEGTFSADSVIEFQNTKLELLSDVINDIIGNKRYEIVIESDKGTVFKDDENGIATLTCRVRGNEMNIDPTGTNLNYQWYRVEGEERTALASKENSPHQLEVNILDIGTVAHIECDVSFK